MFVVQIVLPNVPIQLKIYFKMPFLGKNEEWIFVIYPHGMLIIPIT
jgi:hypothetical protein